MWLIVSKPTQFMAVYKIIQNSDKDIAIPLLVYVAHLSLGDAWNKVFFGLVSSFLCSLLIMMCRNLHSSLPFQECTGRGLVVIKAFWVVLFASAYLFYKVDQAAGLLMLPTCAWVSVATALQWSIFLLNGED